MVSSSCEQRVWRNLEIDNKAHVICFIRNNESWKVILTDLIEIWIEYLTHETMFRKCQALNPLLRPLEAIDWKQLVMDMLNDIPKHVVEASVFQIKLRKDQGFIKLKFWIDLVKGTPRQFWENVTMPFCLSSMEIVRQHEILLDLVRKKDEEIAEYKAGGAELIRKYIATKPFNEELFQTDTAVSVATDFAKAFQSVLNCCNTITLPRTHVKIEPAEASTNGASDDVSGIEENRLVNLSKDEPVEETRQNESYKDEESEENKCQVNPSACGSSIWKLSNTSHSIQKSLKKKKKTLSDLIL
ncbi:PREDICTED: uncharacterized protein LOC106748841 [Dinoponera quadriceps]|uniref:Non-homologous end-joining factor 1 n=1 Tax=Dinoponera quadriceps TaxID=609295 RepID=A0A6P3XZ41_DINQU|nr:PREDICTED: uncharacterized protein LOC106748841 [Dinoponera quadriceps]